MNKMVSPETVLQGSIEPESACEPTNDGSDSNSMLKHCVETDFEQLSPLRSEWDALVENVGGDLYSSYDWCAVWWRHYGARRRLQVHLFYDRERLVAVLPLFLEKLYCGLLPIHVIRLVGCDHSTSTCAPVIYPDRMSDVITTLVRSLNEQGRWDLLHFGPLPGYFNQGQDIDRALQSSPGVGRTCFSADDGPHTVFELPESLEAYLAALPSSERKTFRKRERRFEKAHVRRDVMVAPTDAQREFDEFVGQHQTQWRAMGQMGHFRDWPGSEDFHRDMVTAQAECGRLMFQRLEADGESIGFQYSYRFGPRVHWLLTSRSLDKKWNCYAPGRILFCSTLAAAIDAGATLIDGMRGMYEYKMKYGGSLLKVQSVFAVRSGFMNRLRVAIALRGASLLHLLYYRIWFGRVAPKVPKLKRPLWRIWIRSRL